MKTICKQCKNEYELPYWKYKEKKRHNKPMLCSQSCAGKYHGTGKSLLRYMAEKKKEKIQEKTRSAI